MVKVSIDITKEPTAEQLKMLEALENRPVVPDEDCPELTEEQLHQFQRVSEEEMKKFLTFEYEDKKANLSGRQSEFLEKGSKLPVTAHLSPEAFLKAKSLGTGYTSVLSRILENVLADEEALKHYVK